MTKNVSLFALQQQEVIIFIWITLGLYDLYSLKVSHAYLFMLRCMQELHCWRCESRAAGATLNSQNI
jgi:hypothetical protein